MAATIDWSGTSGDLWARHWRATDRGLARVGEALNAAIDARAPAEGFRALDVGCGPGTTALALAERRPDATVIGCDVSRPLVEIASTRAEGHSNLCFVNEDAEQAARTRGPFELVFSRHGVMFFDDPLRAFRTLREATCAGGAMVFSCFADWRANPWASALADAVAGAAVPPPGREPGGFAFTEHDYVRGILAAAGWTEAERSGVEFTYVAGEGEDAIDEATGFFSEIGPSARQLADVPDSDREPAIERMRGMIAQYCRDGRVEFPGEASIWSARAG